MNVNRGGKWEDTHGGLRAGETSIDGMIRELNEELGINVNSNELKLVKTLKRKNVFRDCYILLKDIMLESIKFNDNEVRKGILKTAEIAGHTIKMGDKRHYLLANVALVGEAIMLAMRTNYK